nr:hypothetical protein [Salmonella enterica]
MRRRRADALRRQQLCRW